MARLRAILTVLWWWLCGPYSRGFHVRVTVTRAPMMSPVAYAQRFGHRWDDGDVARVCRCALGDKGGKP